MNNWYLFSINTLKGKKRQFNSILYFIKIFLVDDSQNSPFILIVNMASQIKTLNCYCYRDYECYFHLCVGRALPLIPFGLDLHS